MLEKPLLLSKQDALFSLIDTAPVISDVEIVKTQEANGRFLAQSIYSSINVPNTDNSAMDGYAVRCEDCMSGNAVLPVTQRIQAGKVGMPLKPGEVARIFTGAPVPENADTIVIQENCIVKGGTVQINHVPKLGEHIRKAGESIRKEDKVLDKGIRLKAQHLGLAASIGCLDLPVIRRPKVAFISTGDEVVMPGETLKEGYVYNSNRYLLRSLLESFGCAVTDYGIVPDDLKAIQKAISDCAIEHDLILASGGMSVGEEDHVKSALDSLGKINFWRVAVKPGKPLAYADVSRKDNVNTQVGVVPFIGLPGNPVSSFVCFLIFVRPFLLRMMGVSQVDPPIRLMRADFTLPKADERNEFLRARINDDGGLDLFHNQGSGVLSSITWSDGIIDNPPGNLIQKGDMVRFLSFDELMYS